MSEKLDTEFQSDYSRALTKAELKKTRDERIRKRMLYVICVLGIITTVANVTLMIVRWKFDSCTAN